MNATVLAIRRHVTKLVNVKVSRSARIRNHASSPYEGVAWHQNVITSLVASQWQARPVHCKAVSNGEDKGSIESKLKALNEEHDVMIYSKTYCYYSAEAKAIFDSLSTKYYAIELDEIGQ